MTQPDPTLLFAENCGRLIDSLKAENARLRAALDIAKAALEECAWLGWSGPAKQARVALAEIEEAMEGTQ